MTFKALNWSPNELIGEEKMDTMTDNAEDLFLTTPRVVYTLPGLARVEGVKIASGRAIITPRNTDIARVQVSFGNYFSNGCQPIITTGILSYGQIAVFVVITGIGMQVPDHQGFNAEVNIASSNRTYDKFVRTTYINWTAIGY